MTPRDIVLVVDDSPETVRLLTDVLEGVGLTVLVALDGRSALSVAEQFTPDVVLMDAVMPGTDGFETCRQLKARKSLSHVPVIFMTALSETEHIVKGFEAGGVDYLTKPIVPDELTARIHAHLANARLLQSAREALDISGRFLLAASSDGRVLWSTPRASRLLGMAVDGDSRQSPMVAPLLAGDVAAWLRRHGGGDSAAPESIKLRGSHGEALQLSFVGSIRPDEFLLRLTWHEPTREELILRDRLALTLREGEVLLWIARGKSNRDIAEILGLSPKTVKKHLEQIYDKLGIENRASAAAMAVRVLGQA